VRDYRCTPAELQPGADHPRAVEFQAFLDGAIASAPLPGLALAVHDADGVWAGAAGFADIGTGDALQSCNIVPVASVTKTIAAVSVAQLVQSGDLGWGDRLADRLPPETIAGIPNTESVTISQLLDHTSGIPDTVDEAMLNCYTCEWTTEDLLDSVRGASALNAPGEGWNYSGTNYILLSLVVEEATGRRHSDVLADDIFSPLGMVDSWYGRARPYPASSLVRGYTLLRARGPWAEFDFPVETWRDPAEGGAVSTAVDLLRLDDDLFRDHTLLTEDTVGAMQTWVDLGQDFHGGRWDRYGYGLLSGETPAGRSVGMSGSLLSTGSDLYWLPDVQTSYALLYNGNGDDAAIQAMNEELTALLAR
jgi:CubicO group peptidase (beta-lactamase class C family)